MAHGEMISEVYGESFRRLVMQLYALTGDLGEAQEVVQEAFVRALCAPRGFADLQNPEAWLRKVATNLARSRWRRRRVLDLLLRRVVPDPVVPDSSPEHIALLSALRELPTGQRHALALHYLSDLPIDEVARTLDVSVGTVKSRLHRGRAALAVMLTDPLDAGVPQPPLDELALRAKRRNRRHRNGVLAAVVVAVIGAIAAGRLFYPLFPISPADGISPTPTASPQPTPVLSSADFVPDSQGDLVTVFDQYTAVVVSRSCMIRVRVTTDTGRSWSPWRMPVQTIDCLGEKDAAFELLSPTTYTATVIGKTYLTSDSGETWREWKPTVYTLPGIPDRMAPRGCDGCRTTSFETVAPDGRVLRTDRQPGLRSWSLTRQTAVGAFWLLGTANDGSSAVARTEDGGRSWFTGPLPANLRNATLAAPNWQTAYVVGEVAGAEVVYATADGGRTWTQNSAPQLQSLVAEQARPSASAFGGRLLVKNSAGTFWISERSGAEITMRAYAPIPSVPKLIEGGGSARSGAVIWAIGVDDDIITVVEGDPTRRILGPPSL
ncbi:RNA polymerase sigma-70 factor (sigma-E family) [Allocatelliglobosispora scoriae]|uniref:RNA polymerase sigma factor n=1 Tax=Allocatelliglobosispora scoriae TaxID=643052 RepID=A0A841BTL5_9ACTN|nr:sigma-70 family RNA polymerase sigma factor [Allocatelliglobosispora scoriae]MBB5870778.1 RNA polymerase sigma-70 factor (sigma-E family) [Allocatelliglobosispora scoriae]